MLLIHWHTCSVHPTTRCPIFNIHSFKQTNNNKKKQAKQTWHSTEYIFFIISWERYNHSFLIFVYGFLYINVNYIFFIINIITSFHHHHHHYHQQHYIFYIVKHAIPAMIIMLMMMMMMTGWIHESKTNVVLDNMQYLQCFVFVFCFLFSLLHNTR